MSRSRLPQPPPTTRGSARPLPPEPTSSSGSDDVPPPLPSRPAPHRGGHIPPPPIQNGSPSPTLIAEDTYEEPEQNLIPPPPRSAVPARSAAPAVQEGEIYDDLEEGQQQPEPEQQNGYTQDEVYDQCDVPQNEEAEPELYQVPDEIPLQPSPQLPPPPPMKEPEPELEPEDSGLYEFVPETKVETNVRNVPPPPMNNPPSRSQMPAPGIPQPPLPKRPTPQKERPPSPPDDDGAPVLPGRPGAGGSKPPKTRQLSGEGPVMPAFSSELIGNKIAQLKKVNSREKPDTEDKADKVETDMPEADSVRNRILMFKQQAGTGSRPAITKKPFLPVKPSVSTVKPSSPVGKTSKQEPKMEEPPPPPPPPAVEHSPAQAHVKMPPPPPVSQDECDDIYDDGMSYIKDPMTQHEWYHGEIERKESDGRLKQIGQDGTFLVRKSSKGGQTQPYTLVVLYQNHVYNLKIRTRSDEQVALGEVKPDELAFKDVPTLISHHRTNDVILVNKMEQKQYTTLLKKFPVAINR